MHRSPYLWPLVSQFLIRRSEMMTMTTIAVAFDSVIGTGRQLMIAIYPSFQVLLAIVDYCPLKFRHLIGYLVRCCCRFYYYWLLSVRIYLHHQRLFLLLFLLQLLLLLLWMSQLLRMNYHQTKYYK